MMLEGYQYCQTERCRLTDQADVDERAVNVLDYGLTLTYTLSVSVKQESVSLASVI